MTLGSYVLACADSLTALECHGTEGLTMSQLAKALEVTGRRVTALVDALNDEGLVERYAHPTNYVRIVRAMDAPAPDGPGEHPDFVNRRQQPQLAGTAGVARRRRGMDGEVRRRCLRGRSGRRRRLFPAGDDFRGHSVHQVRLQA
jgi:hypothetical protein